VRRFQPPLRAFDPPTATKPQPGGVIKRLSPGAAGTRRLLDRYGDALVCVRYREDQNGNSRYTTIELIVDRRPAKPPRKATPQPAATPQPVTAFVRINYDEEDLRQRVKAAGGTWDPKLRLWKIPQRAIQPLGLSGRIAKIPTNG
jgi:hypothetical protein